MRFIFLTFILFVGYFVVFHAAPTNAGETFVSSDVVSSASAGGGPAEPRIDPGTVGGKLFMENCARCHSAKLQQDLTGPALWGVGDRVDRAKLAQWIKNSAKVIESGDPYFVALQKKYNGAAMDPMPHLKPDQIEAIIDEITMQNL